MARLEKENKPQRQDFNKFSNHLKSTLESAGSLASQLGHKSVELEHLLFGLTSQRGSLAGEAIISLGLTSEKLKPQIQSQYPIKISDFLESVDFSQKSKEAINLAVKIAYQHKHKYIGSEHLLAALLQTKTDGLTKIIKEAGLDIVDLEKKNSKYA